MTVRMPRRIEIELTSLSADGSWTWRAAGARQPKGTVTPELVPPGSAAGDVLRAEVESGLDGIEIIALLPAKAAGSEPPSDRIELLGAPLRGPDVSVTYAGGPRRRRDDDRPRREGERRGPAGARRPSAGGSADRGPRRGRERTGSGDPADDRRSPDRRSGASPERREWKPAVSTVHRNALLSILGPEQLPVAEQLLRGGIPAVRAAIEEQNQAAKRQGTPPVASEPVLAIAEALLPQVNLASWKDRATSAQAAGRELRLRELRAVVAASRTVSLDDEGRALAKALQESLDHRVTALRDGWIGRIAKALDDGKVLEALQASTRPPEPATRCPAELAVRLAESAGAAMSADLPGHDWMALLEAVIDSPVRRTVRPVGLPSGEDVAAAARNAAGLVPELAKLLGLRIPPPPPRRTAVRRVPLSRAGGGGAAAAP